MKNPKKAKSVKCEHPVTRIRAWFAYSYQTNKVDIPCVACCECGEVLAGGAE